MVRAAGWFGRRAGQGSRRGGSGGRADFDGAGLGKKLNEDGPADQPPGRSVRVERGDQLSVIWSGAAVSLSQLTKARSMVTSVNQRSGGVSGGGCSGVKVTGMTPNRLPVNFGV